MKPARLPALYISKISTCRTKKNAAEPCRRRISFPNPSQNPAPLCIVSSILPRNCHRKEKYQPK